MYTCLWVVEPYRLYSDADATSAASMPSRICPARRPPPIASKAIVAPVATSAVLRSSVNDGAVELHTCSAPADRSSASCSVDRTMLTRPMPSARHSRFSIWPRFDAAAVCTRAVWPSRRIVPTRPSTVSGFTKHDAPSTAGHPAGSSRHCETSTHRYCEYIAPPSTATVLPSSAWAASDAPAATTVPAPSLPTGRESPTRPARPGNAAGGTVADTVDDVARTGEHGLAHVGTREQQPEVGRVERCRLDTHEHLALRGVGTSMVCRDSCRVPSASTRERNCKALLGISVMAHPDARRGRRPQLNGRVSERESDSVTVLVMAPWLGADLSYVAIDPRVVVVDGNAALASELHDEDPGRAGTGRRGSVVKSATGCWARRTSFSSGIRCPVRSSAGHPACGGRTTPRRASRTCTAAICGPRTSRSRQAGARSRHGRSRSTPWRRRCSWPAGSTRQPARSATAGSPAAATNAHDRRFDDGRDRARRDRAGGRPHGAGARHAGDRDPLVDRQPRRTTSTVPTSSCLPIGSSRWPPRATSSSSAPN